MEEVEGDAVCSGQENVTEILQPVINAGSHDCRAMQYPELHGPSHRSMCSNSHRTIDCNPKTTCNENR